MNDLTTQKQSPVAAFKADLRRLKEAGELDMLPDNVSFEAFRNAAVVAITDNPAILQCGSQSVFKALRRLAAAGLVPDGREAAIVPFRGEAQAMPMVSGLIKTARNSGEIVSIWADVVYDTEELRVWVDAGERKFDHTYDPLNRKGEITGAYAVAKLKDGTIEFEPMGRDQIEKRRRASANQKGEAPTGIWQQWYDEMSKKTVIRALCKRLPISSEDMRRIYVEQEETSVIRDVTPTTPEPETPRPNLAQRLAEKAKAPLDGEIMPPEDEDQRQPDPTTLEYAEGRTAGGKEGTSLKDCPYGLGTDEAMNWMAGWTVGKEDDA